MTTITSLKCHRVDVSQAIIEGLPETLGNLNIVHHTLTHTRPLTHSLSSGSYLIKIVIHSLTTKAMRIDYQLALVAESGTVTITNRKGVNIGSRVDPGLITIPQSFGLRYEIDLGEWDLTLFCYGSGTPDGPSSTHQTLSQVHVTGVLNVEQSTLRPPPVMFFADQPSLYLCEDHLDSTIVLPSSRVHIEMIAVTDQGATHKHFQIVDGAIIDQSSLELGTVPPVRIVLRDEVLTISDEVGRRWTIYAFIVPL